MKLMQNKMLFTLVLVLAGGALAHAQLTNAPAPPQYSAFSRFIANHNIFDPERRPAQGPRPPRRPNPVVESFSFTGTISYRKGDFALFDGTSQNFRKTLEVDGEIAGFKVTDVKLDSVTLVADTNETVMKISSQMRREDGGPWTYLADAGTYSGNSFSSGVRGRRNDSFGNGSFGNNRFNTGRFGTSDFGRGGRQNDFNNFNRNNFTRGNDFTSQANNDTSGGETDSTQAEVALPDDANMPEDGQPGAEPGADAGGLIQELDSSDPLTRLMLQRQQEQQRLSSQQ